MLEAASISVSRARGGRAQLMFPGRGSCSENSRARHRWSQSMRASALSTPSTGLISLYPFKTEGIALGGIEENSNAGSPNK